MADVVDDPAVAAGFFNIALPGEPTCCRLGDATVAIREEGEHVGGKYIFSMYTQASGTQTFKVNKVRFNGYFVSRGLKRTKPS